MVTRVGITRAETRELFCRDSKVIYCNGMTATENDAQNTAAEITEITGRRVIVHHNNTTPLDKTLEMGVKGVAGAVGAIYFLNSLSKERTDFQRCIDCVVGAASAVSIYSAISDFNDIQNLKEDSSVALVDRILECLEMDPLFDVTLILHSQGADIGRRALEKLGAYKNRIHVITIGGKELIDTHLANRVVNFQNDSDLVSKVANSFSKAQGPKVAIKAQNCRSPVCHHASDYLAQPRVRAEIRQLSQPRLHRA